MLCILSSKPLSASRLQENGGKFADGSSKLLQLDTICKTPLKDKLCKCSGVRIVIEEFELQAVPEALQGKALIVSKANTREEAGKVECSRIEECPTEENHTLAEVPRSEKGHVGPSSRFAVENRVAEPPTFRKFPATAARGSAPQQDRDCKPVMARTPHLQETQISDT